ncbi:MAG: hypothetical protein MN733_09160 [Nitrososphaera sp.]|nr:hypothetical protein [Nitrososphaera sp.]
MRLDDYTIQEGTEADLTKISGFFKHHKFGLQEERLVKWKYFSNPAGPARIFMVTHGAYDVKGIAVFMPRVFTKPSGEKILLMQATDGFASRELRAKGLFARLLEYCTGVIGAPIYTFPNKLAERTEIKIGWRGYGEIDSWYFPVKVGRRLAERTTRFFVPLGDWSAEKYAYLRLGRARNDIKVVRVTRFQRHFLVPTGQAWGERSAEYLNWRFIDNPLREFLCFEFIQGDEPIGYCAFTQRDAVTELYDFIVVRNPKRCLRSIVEMCRNESMEYIFSRAVGLNLSKLGFIKLKSLGNMIVHNLPQCPWVITSCDSDWD